MSTAPRIRIVDICGEFDATLPSEVDEILGRRPVRGANSYWISRNGNEVPKLALLVKDDFAALHFFPANDHPFFRSVGQTFDIDRAGDTAFPIGSDPGDFVEVVNDAIIPVAAAIEAAKEFISSGDMPRSITWLEL